MRSPDDETHRNEEFQYFIHWRSLTKTPVQLTANRPTMASQKPFVTLEALGEILDIWIVVFMQQFVHPVVLQKRLELNNRIYYYLKYEGLTQDEIRTWKPNIEKLIGEKEWMKFLLTTQCFVVTYAMTNMMKNLMQTHDIKIDDEIVTKVTAMDVQVDPKWIKPIVRCYCDPNTPPQDIEPKDMDPIPGTLHSVIVLDTDDKSAYVMDYAGFQYDYFQDLQTDGIQLLEEFKKDKITAMNTPNIIIDMIHNGANVLDVGGVLQRQVDLGNQVRDNLQRSMEGLLPMIENLTNFEDEHKIIAFKYLTQ